MNEQREKKNRKIFEVNISEKKKTRGVFCPFTFIFGLKDFYTFRQTDKEAERVRRREEGEETEKNYAGKQYYFNETDSSLPFPPPPIPHFSPISLTQLCILVGVKKKRRVSSSINNAQFKRRKKKEAESIKFILTHSMRSKKKKKRKERK